MTSVDLSTVYDSVHVLLGSLEEEKTCTELVRPVRVGGGRRVPTNDSDADEGDRGKPNVTERVHKLDRKAHV